MEKTILKKEEKKPIYFMMNAPIWYIDLPDEEKMEYAEQIAAVAGTGHTLTEEEIDDLLAGREV
jgi:hypothetical protein